MLNIIQGRYFRSKKMTHMQSDQFWTSIGLLGLPIVPIQASSSIYAVGQFLKTKIILGRTDGPSQRTHG